MEGKSVMLDLIAAKVRVKAIRHFTDYYQDELINAGIYDELMTILWGDGNG